MLTWPFVVPRIPANVSARKDGVKKVSTMMERLLNVQDRDRRISKLRREQADIPERIRQVEARLDAHREALKAAQDEQKKNAAAMKQLEVEIETRKQKITKYREQQLQIKNNNEYKALEHEIRVVEKEIRGLEDQEIDLMEKAEELRTKISGREKDLGLEEKRVHEDQAVLKKRLESMEGEVASLSSDRSALAKDVDPAWLSRYERIFKKSGDFAIVPVENGACGGCHMKLPPHLVHETKRALTLVECSYCSRILYWKP